MLFDACKCQVELKLTDQNEHSCNSHKNEKNQTKFEYSAKLFFSGCRQNCKICFCLFDKNFFFEKVLYKSPQDLLIILSHSSWLIVMLQPYIRLLNVYIYRENLLLSINKFLYIDMRMTPLIIQIYNCQDPCKTPSKSFHLRHTRHVIMRHII